MADILKDEYGYISMSFAACLKDAVAAIFCWPRALLEGDTGESRAWRETVDLWWAEKLGMANFTPRLALQVFGTEVIRNNFHYDIWLLNVERRIAEAGPDAKIVITDARFPNELHMTTRLGGKIVRVKRGPDPAWWDKQLQIWRGAKIKSLGENVRDLLESVHESERAWARDHYDHIIDNKGDLADLKSFTTAMLHVLFPVNETPDVGPKR